jgi:ParB family transcriptional regulator, chromosome partitioning protein
VAVKRKGGFFGQMPTRPEDDLARQQDVEALIVPRRTVVQDVPIERIRPNPFQARREFSDLQELADAIKVQGFTSRLRVRPNPTLDGYFELVYGERRLRAAALAGRTDVPCEIAEHSDEEMIEIGLAENIQRRDLTPIEEAQAFQTFIKERGYTVRSLAEKIGKDKSYIQDRIELTRVPVDVQAMVSQRSDTLRAAREIAKVPSSDERKPLIDAILDGRLNVHHIRTIVSNRLDTGKTDENVQHIDNSIRQIQRKQADEVEAMIEAPSRLAKREPSLDRLIEREGRLLLSTLAHWQEIQPELSTEQRKLMQFYVEEISSRMQTFKKPR